MSVAEPPSEKTRGSGLRAELGRGLEIAALVGVAVVQPVLGPFGESPETFVGVGAQPADIVAFALIVTLVPFLAIWLGAALARLAGERTRSIVQSGLVATLAAIGAVALSPTSWSPVARTLLGLVVGAAALVVHRRWLPGRLFLRYASPLLVVLVLSFLLASPTSTLLRQAAAEEPAQGTGQHPPVVLVILDELPTLSLMDGRGGIDATLFPNLARVADTSTWYRNHTSVTSATQTSLPAMLTGRMTPNAADQKAATSVSFPDNLITLLARTHEVHGREWATQMCPPSLCPPPTGDIDPELGKLLGAPLPERANALGTLLGEARDLWSSQVWPSASPGGDEAATIAGMRSADDRTRLVLEFISGIEAQQGDRPAFDYLHAPFPHTPWTALPSGQTYDGPEIPFGAELLLNIPEGPDGQELADAARSRHLLQLEWTDRLLGVLIDRLEQVDRWDDAVVVVTADHGVAFEAGHHMRIVDPATEVQLAWTPLFIKEPGQQSGRVVDEGVTALDVVPTVAELAGVDLDWDHEGASLVDGVPSGDRTKPMSVAEPAEFEERLTGTLVALDADGLAEIKAGPATGPASDELRVWRHGRHGDLLGRSVDDVGVCSGEGPAIDIAPSPAWDDYVAGKLPPGDPLPLWRSGTIADDAVHDIAAVVDDRVVAWTVTATTYGQQGNRVGMLLTEPLVRSASADPVYYEIVDGPSCQLRALPT